MRQARVVIVGAGIGGLACAIDLAAAGLDVTVVERAERAGGKMREVEVGGSAVDCGPTVLTMRWVFDAIFEAAGSTLESEVGLTPLDILARHAWSGSERLDLFADAARSEAAIGDFAGAKEAAGFRAFSAESRRIYETLKDTFLAAQTTGPIGLGGRIGLGRTADLTALRPFETMWRALGDHFADPRLRQLFGRYATYCGSSPFAAPGHPDAHRPCRAGRRLVREGRNAASGRGSGAPGRQAGRDLPLRRRCPPGRGRPGAGRAA